MPRINLSEKECNKRVREIRSVIVGDCDWCGNPLSEHNLTATRGTLMGCPKNERFLEIAFPLIMLLGGLMLGFIIRP